jgi:1-acyl-sn-glycerol-3-phosphate acyltransferase
MIHTLRFLIRASLALVWVIAGLLHIGLAFPWLPLSGRLYSKKIWSVVLLRICGVSVTQSGTPVTQGPVLFVVNHVSWLDIFILNCARATAFVAKSEIRHWPLVGWLAHGADTIFIERASRHAVHKVGVAMQEHFERGQSVGLFPEGTTSGGDRLLPFYANLFEPARKAGAVIQPVVLKYYHHGRRSDFAAFVGEQTLLHNMWCVLGSTGTAIEMIFVPVIWDGQGEPPVRAELSRSAHQQMDQILLS